MKRYFWIIGLIAIFFSACQKGSNIDSPTGNETGKGGSMARFAIVGNYLYAVDNNTLKVFDISVPAYPVYLKSKNIGNGIETIFPKDSLLFIGTQIGMLIFELTNPTNPLQISSYQHIYSCDPVVADDKYAYVTLHSAGSRCGRTTNELHIVDISNIQNPVGRATYQMTSPMGLGIDGNLLFVCDDGLKVYNASDPLNLVLKSHFHIKAFDVIPYQNNLMVIGDDGLYQYKYQNDTIYPQSKIVFE